MTSPTVLPAAALRVLCVLREAAGRRALQLALLVGGLLALGFLCGGQAQAAEGTTASVKDVTAALSEAAPTSGPVPAVHTDRVLQPLREVVTAVTEKVAEATAELPVSSLPNLPNLPDLPDVSEPPSLPVQTLPVPVVQTPAPDSPVTSSPDGDRFRHASPEHKAADAATVSYGPVVPVPVPALGDAAGVRAASHNPVHIGAGHAPAHRAPGGVPSGLLGGASTLDGGASRHGDAHAVTVSHRMPVPLVSGGAVRSDADGTRDGHRDIPVFPG
ncbi:hypothetical protein [Streptomyces sp. T028]|uniref:hypothetical protein n=1 Tax=Streptomyces sp. T028 TaxID=3394379 RepID=UPI003A88FB9B